jgi:hypothetical protein
MRIGDDLLDQLVPPLSIVIGQSVIKSPEFGALDFVVEIPFFLMAERLAIGDEKLQIARVWAIDGGIIDLIDDSVAQCKPNL